MDFQQLIESITPDIYNNLKRAVELGRWPNGSKLTPEQRKNSLQAIIAYDARYKVATDRVGYIPPKQKPASCDSDHAGDEARDNKAEQPLKWHQ